MHVDLCSFGGQTARACGLRGSKRCRDKGCYSQRKRANSPREGKQGFFHTLCTCGADASKIERGYPIGVKHHITEVTVRPRVTLKSDAELEPARKPWKASKPTASSQIPLTPGSRSPRSLSLLPQKSENVLPIKRTLNRLENDLSRSGEDFC